VSSIPAARLERIRSLVDERGVVTIQDLGRDLGVSGMTVRRDLEVLERAGALRRTRGGALSTTWSLTDRPYRVREALETSAKDRIGELAASLVDDDDAVFLSSGTTSLAVARHLLGRSGITVVTNSVQAVALLAEDDGIVVISTGGRANRDGGDLSGPLTDRTLGEFRVRKAIIGASGITPAGVTNSSVERAATDRLMVAGADSLIVVADHGKFGQDALALVVGLDHVSGVVTDAGVAVEHLEWLDDAGVPVHVAPPGDDDPADVSTDGPPGP
jgi:DeoR/GlpR family transcriptional regulator of sugar metabolism